MKNDKGIVKYYFDLEIAQNLGVEEAIMFHNLQYWCNINKKKNRNFQEERYWVFRSQQSLSEDFPFWSKRQIQRLLTNLIKNHYIIKGNYNKHKYDKTGWYACIYINCETNDTVSCHPCNHSVLPIQDNKKDNRDMPKNKFLGFSSSSCRDPNRQTRCLFDDKYIFEDPPVKVNKRDVEKVIDVYVKEFVRLNGIKPKMTEGKEKLIISMLKRAPSDLLVDIIKWSFLYRRMKLKDIFSSEGINLYFMHN